MNHFQYKGNELFAEDVAIKDIVANVGSPVYVYSHATLERHFKAFDDAFAAMPHTICYSVKANSNQSVLKNLHQSGRRSGYRLRRRTVPGAQGRG